MFPLKIMIIFSFNVLNNLYFEMNLKRDEDHVPRTHTHSVPVYPIKLGIPTLFGVRLASVKYNDYFYFIFMFFIFYFWPSLDPEHEHEH